MVFIVEGMLKRKQWAFTLGAIFMGLLGILWVPSGDLYRYTEDFYLYYKDCDWNALIRLIQFKVELFLPLLSYLLGKLGIPFDISRLIYAFISYYLMGKMLLSICQNNEKIIGKVYLYAIITFIPLAFIGFLYRYNLSSVLVGYGFYLSFFLNKKVKGWVYISLACVNHLSFVIFALLALMVQLRAFHCKRKTFLILAVSVFVIVNSFTTLFLDLVPMSGIFLKYVEYLSGYWAGEYLQDKSIKAMIMLYLSYSIIYVGIGIYWLYYNECDRKYTPIVNAVIILVLIVSPFSTIYARFLMIVLFMVKLYFLFIYRNYGKQLNYLKIFCWCSIISTLLSVWTFRREMSCSEEYRILYANVYQIVTFSYTETWIDENVDSNGRLIKVDY